MKKTRVTSLAVPRQFPRQVPSWPDEKSRVAQDDAQITFAALRHVRGRGGRRHPDRDLHCMDLRAGCGLGSGIADLADLGVARDLATGRPTDCAACRA